MELFLPPGRGTVKRFGSWFNQLKNFKCPFIDALRYALAAYPKGRVDVREDGIVLHPLSSPIPQQKDQLLSLAGRHPAAAGKTIPAMMPAFLVVPYGTRGSEQFQAGVLSPQSRGKKPHNNGGDV